MAAYLTNEQARQKMNSVFPNYDFSKFNYVTRGTPSQVTCEHGHTYNTTYQSVYGMKRGCPYCSGTAKKTQAEAIAKMQFLAPKYTFDKFVYKNSTTKSIVTCPKHGDFEVTYFNFTVNNSRCPQCFKERASKSEEEYEIMDFLNEHGIKTIQSYNVIPSPSSKNKLEIDIFLPEYDVGIEYNGVAGHTDNHIRKYYKGFFQTIDQYHTYKSEESKKLGIDLLHVYGREYLKDRNKALQNILHFILNHPKVK